ncbi:transglutaminase-like cysteine peptidase [Rhizobium sp. PAMB 3174]
MVKNKKKPIFLQAAALAGVMALAGPAKAIELPVLNASSSLVMAANSLVFQVSSLPAVASVISNMAGRLSTDILGKSMPQRQAPQTSEATAVFASVPISFNRLPASDSWKKVRPYLDLRVSDACGQKSGCASREQQLERIVSTAKSMPFADRLSAVNRAVNGMIAYTSDKALYGKRDYWAKPSETLQLGKGDCEDLALLKMTALKAMGVPEKSMSIVVLKITNRNIFHAVLAVSTSQGHYILDNLRTNVAMDTSYSNYVPLYSMSADRSWIHGFAKGSANVAAQGVALEGSLPG